MIKKNSLLILYFLSILIIYNCDDEDWGKTKGIYVNEDQYRVIAFGKAPDNVTNKIKARNMAKEAALINAQKQIHKEFNVPVNKIIKSGIIEKKTFKEDNSCCIIYLVNIKTLKGK